MHEPPQRRTETIFHACRERAAGAERQAYLDGACGDDADLRARVEALLVAHDEAEDFLESPAVEPTSEGPGASIGPYKLLQQIGEGGMGVVYMAEQEQPVRRKVALKIIKLGMDTKQVIARFDAERQALAMMDHAHIARVLDAGSTETGRPYFVMELVRGVPVTEYCDTHKLDTNARLGLFIEICRAVQHAHQKGIIHRDLKPNNVLVTSHDGVPVPKIIDFGVAKATNQRLTERTLFTEFHQLIGTPEYMSPEQAEMSGLDVDTRSDIYSLGVLLYQLLTGTTPVDAKALRTAGFEEMTRMIREDEPPAPSTRVSKLMAEGGKIASHGKSDAGALSRHFRGELDWIVMKALEKDRTRRYDTASAFAEDVVRHLEDRPIDAGPVGVGYRLAKFVQRNRRAVAAALALFVVFALGLTGTTAGFLRAKGEAERTGRMSTALEDVLAMTDASSEAGRAEVEGVLATAREVFGEDHATYAAVLDALTRKTLEAGDFESAAELGTRSLEAWRRVVGETHSNTAHAHARLGSALRGLGDTVGAEAALRDALAIIEKLPATPTLVGYETRIELADVLGNRGEYTEAAMLMDGALDELRASSSPQHLRTIETLEQRMMLELNGPNADGRPIIKQLYDEVKAFYADDNPMHAVVALGYGRQLALHGELADAEPFLRDALDRFDAMESPPAMLHFSASDLLFQIVRSRTDEASVEETDDLLATIIRTGATFLGGEQMFANRIYYAGRMFERGRYDAALGAVLEAQQAVLDEDSTIDERERARDQATMMAFRIGVLEGQDAEVYELCRLAAERALAEEPGHPAMQVAFALAQYRLGELGPVLDVLNGLQRDLAGTSGSLARKMAPADHAIRALALRAMGDVDGAREAFERAKETLRRRGGSNEFAPLKEELKREFEGDGGL